MGRGPCLDICSCRLFPITRSGLAGSRVALPQCHQLLPAAPEGGWPLGTPWADSFACSLAAGSRVGWPCWGPADPPGIKADDSHPTRCCHLPLPGFSREGRV